MKFLEAQRTLAELKGGRRTELLLAGSGTLDPLTLYLRAEGAKRGLDLQLSLLPFNTLQQTLFSPPSSDRLELFLLLPWDLAPELDWRSGVPAEAVNLVALRDRAAAIAERILARPHAITAYLPAPIPPVMGTPAEDRHLASVLLEQAGRLGAILLPAEGFSAASYFSSGCPIGGAWLGPVAETLIEAAFGTGREPAKVLVTDLDQVLWRGVLAEDGVDGVRFGPDAHGYRHFIYQGVLSRLRKDGVVLAAVSRNAPDIVAPLLQSGRLLLGEADFVAVIPSYNAKSAQIRLLAEQLNLGLDAFVFVDDNPVELAEVARELPPVRRVPFPDRDDDLPRFLVELTAHFPRTGVTAEDRERTALYRRRLEGMVPAGVAGADLTDFLRGLEMALTLRDCTNGDRARAVQLINKTNQFNINGRRIADEDVGKILAAGGKLYTALLEDRTGSHGEILACLIDADGVIRSLVMSCRVFQRRVEYAFFTWLAGRSMRADRLQFAATDRNEPLRTFLESPAFSPPDENGVVQFDSARFTALHGSDLDLFRVRAIES